MLSNLFWIIMIYAFLAYSIAIFFKAKEDYLVKKHLPEALAGFFKGIVALLIAGVVLVNIYQKGLLVEAFKDLFLVYSPFALLLILAFFVALVKFRKET